MKTTHKTLLKIISAGICLLGTAMVSQGALVYNEVFTATPANQTGTGAQVFNGGAGDLNIWMRATNFNDYNNNRWNIGDIPANPRGRGGIIWLDTSSWGLFNQFTVEYDIKNYVPVSGRESYFQAFSASGVDGSNTVRMDVHQGDNVDVGISTTGSPTFGTIGAKNVITGTVTDFSVSYTPGGAEYIGLLFYTTGEEIAVDNLSVTTAFVTPEPSSLGLLGMGAALLYSRRKQSLTLQTNA